eukprot:1162036-Pelagomonas_calceolata.AAC.13
MLHTHIHTQAHHIRSWSVYGTAGMRRCEAACGAMRGGLHQRTSRAAGFEESGLELWSLFEGWYNLVPLLMVLCSLHARGGGKMVRQPAQANQTNWRLLSGVPVHGAGRHASCVCVCVCVYLCVQLPDGDDEFPINNRACCCVHSPGDDEAASKYAALRARLPDVAAGYAACAKDGLAGVSALEPLVRCCCLCWVGGSATFGEICVC